MSVPYQGSAEWGGGGQLSGSTRRSVLSNWRGQRRQFDRIVGVLRRIRGKPCGDGEAEKNGNRKNDGDDEEVAPTQVRDDGEGDGERPRAEAHCGEGLRWKSGELPGDDGG